MVVYQIDHVNILEGFSRKTTILPHWSHMMCGAEWLSHHTVLADHTVVGVVFLARSHRSWCALSYQKTHLLVWFVSADHIGLPRSPDDPLAECVLQISQLLEEAGVGAD